jgi:phosphatidylethanolamine N-methyltransferase
LLEKIILNVRLLSKEIVERNSGYEFDYLKEPIEYSSFIIFKQILILIWVNETVSYCLFVLKYAKDDIYTYTSAIYDLISSNDLTFIFHTILKISLNVKYLQQIGGILIVFLNIYFIKEIYNNEDPYLHFYGNFFFTKNTTRKLNTVPHPLYSIGNIGYYGSALITQSYTVLLVGLVCHALQIIFLYIVIRPEQAMLETKELENDERLHVYINKDLYIFMNFDLFRGGDFLTFLIVGYTVISAIMIGPIDTLAKKKFYMGQALFFRIIHTLGMFYFNRDWCDFV